LFAGLRGIDFRTTWFRSTGIALVEKTRLKDDLDFTTLLGEKISSN